MLEEMRIPLRELDRFPFIAFVSELVPGFYGVEPVFIIMYFDVARSVKGSMITSVLGLQLPPPGIFLLILALGPTQHEIVAEQLQRRFFDLGKMVKMLALDLGVLEEGW